MKRPGRTRPVLGSVWPLLLLVASLGIVLKAAWNLQASERDQRMLAADALRAYGEFAAWSYEQHAAVELSDAFREYLHNVNHGDQLHTSPLIPRADGIVHYLPWDTVDCWCHRAAYAPTIVFGYELGSDTVFAAANLHEGPTPGIRVTPMTDGVVRAGTETPVHAIPPGDRAWLVDSLTVHARTRYRAAWRIGVVPAPAQGGTALLGYTLMPTVRGDTILYGIQLPPAEVRRLFDYVLDDGSLLPEPLTAGLANREILSATIAATDGRAVYRSDAGALAAAPVVAETRLHPRLGGMTVRAAIRPEAAGNLLIGGEPRSRMPLLLGLLLLAAALSVVAVAQLRRESRFARQRGDFVAAVSHELRTPLAQLWLFFDTLRLGRFRTDAQRRGALDRIEQEMSRLTHLVENVLHFAGSEHGARAADPALLVLAGEVREAAAAFAPLAEVRGARLDLDLDDELAVRVDRRQLRQVLINLLDNAVKYGPEGQTIRVLTRWDDGRVRLAVEDQGPGVAARERDRIWEPYRRGTGPVERAVGGTGIGLSIVRDIVERHDGRARVEAGAAGGARFVIDLPGERLDGLVRPPAAAATAAPDAAGNGRGATDPAAATSP